MRDDTRAAILAADYPLSTEELIARCGSERAVGGSDETVADALGRLGEETFETPEEARLAVLTGLSSTAIGRKDYSDRDPVVPGSVYGPREVSF